MAWSIFTQGGGNGAALQWADDLLADIGAPKTVGDEQFVYDWEKSEGGGGKFNPLNQGPVPGKASLTSTGQQFGGGAADYVSYQAGLTGAADYLNMPAYKGIKSALVQGNGVQARSALWASPWAASHYGFGSAWNNSAIPGKASALQGGGDVSPIQTDSIITGAAAAAGGGITGVLLKGLGVTDIGDALERGALIIFGAAIILIGVIKLIGTDRIKHGAETAAGVALIAK